MDGMNPSESDWPTCACGCGESVPIRKASVPAKGLKRGEPCKYVAGHSSRARRKVVVDGKKHCPKCDTLKSVEAYSRNRGRPSGLEPWCKDCVAAKNRKWYEQPGNADRIAQAARRFSEANPGYRTAASLRYQATPAGLAQARNAASAYRARKRGQWVEDVDHQVVYERDGGTCGICGEPADRENFHVDHIAPLARGGEHSYANVQVAHPSCNARKKDRHGEQVSAAA